MPAAVRIMADAMTGGDTKALIKMMENGELDPNSALPKFFEEMRKRSEHMLPEYFKSTRFAEGSMNKAAEDQFKRFAKGGGDAGFARLFNSLATALKEASPAVDAMAKGFNEISKYTSFAMLLPQSFKRAFEGRDSWVADQLGQQNIQLIKDWYNGVGEITSEIKTLLSTAVEGWRLYFKEFGDEWLGLLTGIQGVLLYSLKAINAALAGEGGQASNYLAAAVASGAGKSRQEAEAIATGTAPGLGITDAAGGLLDKTPVGMVYDKYTSGYEYLADKTGLGGWWDNFTSLMGRKKPSDGDRASVDYQREMAMSREKFKASQNNQVNIQSGAIVINANTSDPEALSDILMSKLKESSKILLTGQYTETLVSFPQGE